MINKKKLSLALIIFALLIAVAYAQNNAPKRVINVVYDDSLSMYTYVDNNNKIVVKDYWCKAKYSLSVFAALLEKQDTMNVFPLRKTHSSLNDYQPSLVVNGSEDLDSIVKRIEDFSIVGKGTPYDVVRGAMNHLSNQSADQKWLVILTDGEFESGMTIQEDLETYAADSNINIYYLAIGDDAVPLNNNINLGLWTDTAPTSDDIIDATTDISNKIYERNIIRVVDGSFTTDIPLKNAIVFAQGSDVKIGDLKSSQQTIKSNDSVEVKYSLKEAPPNFNEDSVKQLKGRIAYYSDLKPGQFKIDASGYANISVYYIPDVAIKVGLYSDNQEVSDKQNIQAGEYTASYAIINPYTNEVIDSKLLGDINFVLTIENGGEIMTIGSGQKFSIQPDQATLNIEATYLKYNHISTKKTYKVLNPASPLKVTIDQPAEVLNTKNLDDTKKIKIEVSFEDEQLTQDDWDALKITNDQINKKIDYEIEKSKEIGIYYLKLKSYKGDPYKTDYGDAEFNIALELITERGLSLGSSQKIFKISNGFTQFERIIHWLIANAWWLILLLLITIIAWGYYIKKRINANYVSLKLSKTKKPPKYPIKKSRTKMPYISEIGYVDAPSQFFMKFVACENNSMKLISFEFYKAFAIIIDNTTYTFDELSQAVKKQKIVLKNRTAITLNIRDGNRIDTKEIRFIRK